MTDVDLMLRSLRLAWIPSLLTAGDCNWCTVPYDFFRKLGQLALFCRNILKFFKELKALYGYDQGSDLVYLTTEKFLWIIKLYISIIG